MGKKVDVCAYIHAYMALRSLVFLVNLVEMGRGNGNVPKFCIGF